MEGFNLDAIKQEIDERRTKGLVHEHTTGTNKMGAPRDSKKFLVDLLQSVNQGAPTPAVQALRSVTEASDQKFGIPTTTGKVAPMVNGTYQPQQYNQSVQPMNEMEAPQVGDRESFFDQQLQMGYDMLRSRSNQQPVIPNAGLSQSLNEFANAPFMGANSSNTGVNASALNEHISKTMNEMVGNANFVRLVEGAYKNMLNEMYAKEKIEQALVEIMQGDTFKKILKKTIVDTLIEIQNRNKK